MARTKQQILADRQAAKDELKNLKADKRALLKPVPAVTALEQKLKEAEEALTKAQGEYKHFNGLYEQNRATRKTLNTIVAKDLQLNTTTMSLREEKELIRELSVLRKQLRTVIKDPKGKSDELLEAELKGIIVERTVAIGRVEKAKEEIENIKKEILRVRAETEDAEDESLREVNQKISECQDYLQQIEEELRDWFEESRRIWQERKEKREALEKKKQEKKEALEKRKQEEEEQRKAWEEKQKAAEEQEHLLRMKKLGEEAEARHKGWLSREVIAMQWKDSANFVSKHAEEVVMCNQLLAFLEKATNDQLKSVLLEKTARDVQLMLSFQKLNVNPAGQASEVLSRVVAKKDNFLQVQAAIRDKRVRRD